MLPDDDDFDPTDETDAEIHELRVRVRELEAEIVRQGAMLDQITASTAEVAERMEALRAEIRDQNRRLTELEDRYRRHARRMWVQALVCATIGASLAQAVVLLFF